MKTSELTGAAFDWAVAKCEGFDWYIDHKGRLMEEHGDLSWVYQPSTNWAQGGPIIEREKITLNYDNCGPTLLWEAKHFAFDGTELQCEYGSTPLIAAMRCYVASQMGEAVEIPKELE